MRHNEPRHAIAMTFLARISVNLIRATTEVDAETMTFIVNSSANPVIDLYPKISLDRPLSQLENICEQLMDAIEKLEETKHDDSADSIDFSDALASLVDAGMVDEKSNSFITLLESKGFVPAFRQFHEDMKSLVIHVRLLKTLRTNKEKDLSIAVTISACTLSLSSRFRAFHLLTIESWRLQNDSPSITQHLPATGDITIQSNRKTN